MEVGDLVIMEPSFVPLHSGAYMRGNKNKLGMGIAEHDNAVRILLANGRIKASLKKYWYIISEKNKKTS